MKRHLPLFAFAVTLASGTGAIAAPAATEGPGVAIQNRSIAYVMTSEYYAIRQTPGGKEECPKGFNEGPREEYKQLFPDDGTKRKVVDTQLAREAEVWFPHTTPEPFEFKEATGKIAPGLNLDGKIGPNDFTSPDGEKGIDNQLFRAIGCINNYRDNFELNIITTKWRTENSFNRFLIVLTDVDDLTNDDDVTVTTYRGLDKLMTDATGNNFVPGGTQRIDLKWGKEFIQKFHGKIKNGVLITDAHDLAIPEMGAFDDIPTLPFRGLVFKLKLTPDRAEGLMAGYFDVDGWYTTLNQGWATHHQSYGQESAPSLYRALRRLADGYPDPITGRNTAISGALDVKFTQVFVQFPNQQTAGNEREPVTYAEAATSDHFIKH
jgi:hypothetical protein